MTLSRIYRPSTRIEHDELDGLINILDRRIAECIENKDENGSYYLGAKMALTIIRYHEWVELPDDFMLVFDNYMTNGKDE